MTDSHREIFERYLHAGALTRNPDAVAELFTEDGVYEAPLLPLRLAGREAIRTGIGVLQQHESGPVDPARSGFVLHETADPDVFIVEIDVVAGGTPVALLQIFQIRDGLIARLRDYFRDPGLD